MSTMPTSYPTPQLFIDGHWRPGGDGTGSVVRNPATEAVIAEVPRASRQDLDDALASSLRAFGIWRATSAQERAAVLRRAAQLLRERSADIALAMTLEQGKTLGESRLEVELSAETFDWYAGEALRNNGQVLPSRARGGRQMVLPQPLGPVAAFTPWNFPALLPARKIGPALAAGCTVVMKPSEETPASALALARALSDAGLPAGALNMVLGVPADISPHLIGSPIIRKVTFTGSTAVGRSLAHLAAEGVKPCTLELGGHAPVLIFDDADLDRAVATCLLGKTRNAGQVCTSPTRFYVQQGIHDRFVAAFAKALSSVVVGDGSDASSQMGPLANGRRLAAMGELVEEAVSAGANVATGGQRVGTRGSFFQPTLLVDVPAQAWAMNTEPFGPLALVDTFTTLEDGLARANRTPFGLAAYAFTRSAETAMAVSEGLEAGGIGINSFAVSHIEAPFGGLKESGYGHEGGPEGMRSYLHQKYVHHA